MLDRCANLPEVVEAALKVRFVGQDAQAGRAGGLVGAGDGDGVEVGRMTPWLGLAFLTSAMSFTVAVTLRVTCPSRRACGPARAPRGA